MCQASLDRLHLTGRFSNRASFVNFFFVAFRVVVHFAVALAAAASDPVENAWALQRPQRADARSRAHGPYRAGAHT